MEVGGDADKEEGPCEICGSAGFPDQIITCSNCLACREHVYCRRIFVADVSETWICEECESLDSAKSTHPGGNQEVNKSDEAANVMHPRNPAQSHEDYVQQAQRKPRLVPIAKVKQISIEEIVRLSNDLNRSSKKRFFLREKIAALKKLQETQTASRGSLPKVASKCNSFEDIFPLLKFYRWHLPAEEATWRGGFEFLDTVRAAKFYGRFKALPPCSLKRQAYNFSKEMPTALEMQIVPHFHVLEDIFQDGPDLLDIAMYIYASQSMRGSNENYKIVGQYLLKKNSMLRCDFGDVELLVFTSKQLNDRSKETVERLSRGPILCGIFRRTGKESVKEVTVRIKIGGNLIKYPELMKKIKTLNISIPHQQLTWGDDCQLVKLLQ